MRMSVTAANSPIASDVDNVLGAPALAVGLVPVGSAVLIGAAILVRNVRGRPIELHYNRA